MNDLIIKDIEIMLEYLNISIVDFCKSIKISQDTFMRWKNNIILISDEYRNKIYDFAYDNNIYFNIIKEEYYNDFKKDNNILLFHGSKNGIIGDLSIDKSKDYNDFGKGFYCGENISQSSMFVSGYDNSKIYIYEFDYQGLNGYKFDVSREWMLLVAYYRGFLKKKKYKIINELINKIKDVDYIIAPIADNRMLKIINDFINGYITDEQCAHSLVVSNLGYQYILKTPRALKKLYFMEECFLCDKEKERYIYMKKINQTIDNMKSNDSIRKYRLDGKLIGEILYD